MSEPLCRSQLFTHENDSPVSPQFKAEVPKTGNCGEGLCLG